MAPQGIVRENPAMTRRGFLQLTLPAAAAIVVAPSLLEELLTRRTYFLAPAGGWAGEWSVNSLGGYLYSRELSKILRDSVQPLVRFRQFADVAPRPPITSGRFTWDVFSDASL